MAVYKGDAVVFANNLGSHRYFALRTANVAGETPSDRATWEGDAGSSITLYFKTGTTGATPPGTANTVELLVYYETGTGTLVRTLHSGAPPADGTSYTFYFTDDGTTGAPTKDRCGQLRLYVRAQRTTAVTYDVNSDDDGDQGVIRSNMLVNDLAVSAYPAGSKFAYGTAADEQFTLTATHTQKYADRNNETFDIEATNASDVLVEGVNDIEVGAGTTTAQAFTVDDTYATGDNSHGFRFRVNNNGLLRTDEPWTLPVDSGVNVTQDGTTAVKRSSFFTVNPDVTIGTVTLGQTIYNREETATLSFPITNARSENLTRSMTTRIKDSGGTVKKTITDTGSTYGDGGTGDYTIAATDKATNDLTGDQWTLEGNTTGARFTNTPNVYKVSRKWQLGKTGAAVDNGIKTGKTAGADDVTVRNRGQTLFFDGYIYNCRGTLLAGPTVNFNIRPTGSETYEETNDTNILSSGQFQDSYAVDTDEAVGDKTLVVASQTTASANQPRTGTAGSGNFAETSTSTPEWSVSATYTVESRTQKEATRNGDAEDTQFTIGEDVIYAFAQVTDASGDSVVGAHVDFKQINPSTAETQSNLDIVTGAGGWTGDPGQAFDSRAPAGSGWIQRAEINADAANDGNTGTNDQAISMVSAFTANKAVVTGFGPVGSVPNSAGYDTAKVGDAAKPGDRLLLGLAFVVSGARTAPDPTPVPQFLLAQFNQATSKAEVLQADGTWKDQDDVGYVEQYFDFKVELEPDDGEGGSGDKLEWVANIGTAGQGVTTGNGYVMDTSTWNPGSIFMIVTLSYNSQSFETGRAHPFVDPTSNMNPASAGALGHFDGVDFATGFPSK